MLDLHQIPVKMVRGVGVQKAEELQSLGIQTVADLLEYYPYRYEDYRIKELAEVKDGDKVTLQAKIVAEPAIYMYGRNKSRLSCRVVADGVMITAIWFNRHFLRDSLRPGQEIVLTGKWDQKRLHLTVSESEFPGNGTPRSGTLQPVYSVGGSITQKWIRKAVKHALEQYESGIEEILPEETTGRYGLLPRRRAIAAIHQRTARRRAGKRAGGLCLRSCCCSSSRCRRTAR